MTEKEALVKITKIALDKEQTSAHALVKIIHVLAEAGYAKKRES